MPNELILDLTTGVVVVGCVFAAPYVQNLAKRILDSVDRNGLGPKPPQRAGATPYAQEKTAPPSARLGE